MPKNKIFSSIPLILLILANTAVLAQTRHLVDLTKASREELKISRVVVGAGGFPKPSFEASPLRFRFDRPFAVQNKSSAVLSVTIRNAGPGPIQLPIGSSIARVRNLASGTGFQYRKLRIALFAVDGSIVGNPAILFGSEGLENSFLTLAAGGSVTVRFQTPVIVPKRPAQLRARILQSESAVTMSKGEIIETTRTIASEVESDNSLTVK